MKKALLKTVYSAVSARIRNHLNDWIILTLRGFHSAELPDYDAAKDVVIAPSNKLRADAINRNQVQVVELSKRVRADEWYGIFHLKEMWATILFSLALL